MGISQSTDIAQEIMENTLSDFEEVEIYLDDIAIFSKAQRLGIACCFTPTCITMLGGEGVYY